MKKNFFKFIDSIKNESKETKEAFNLVVRASKDEVELNKEQRKKIYDQLKDIFKTIGLTVLTLIPGASIIFLLIKFLKAEKYTLPSSFQ
jgi:predicted neutral ceramidase superfamily lipid hydrolase